MVEWKKNEKGSGGREGGAVSMKTMVKKWDDKIHLYIQNVCLPAVVSKETYFGGCNEDGRRKMCAMEVIWSEKIEKRR